MSSDKNENQLPEPPENWPLSYDPTYLIFEYLNEKQDVFSARLSCRFFANIGKSILLKSCEEKMIADIQQNYPVGLINTFSNALSVDGAQFIARLPILKVRENIEQISPEDLGGHPIVRGKDANGRHFICLNIHDRLQNNQHVLICYQPLIEAQKEYMVNNRNNIHYWKRHYQNPSAYLDVVMIGLFTENDTGLERLIKQLSSGNPYPSQGICYSTLEDDSQMVTKFCMQLFHSPTSSEKIQLFPLNEKDIYFREQKKSSCSCAIL